MRFLFSKHIFAAALVVIALGIGIAVYVNIRASTPEIKPVEEPRTVQPIRAVIGRSTEGRAIESYTYPPRRTGDFGVKHLLFVGGMHGGYEWNSVLLAYALIDYLGKEPTLVPDNLTVTVIPSLNPDGVYKVTGKEGRFGVADVATDKDILASGRFNARQVDLNRNFDCKWKPEGIWKSQSVSAGSAPFSEPEARALRDVILRNTPDAVIFWHSQANAVYASECENGILPETLAVMNAYSRASGYPAVASFDAYEVTGDAEGWLASVNIPAITVELSTHETVEWERNLSGLSALFEYFGKK